MPQPHVKRDDIPKIGAIAPLQGEREKAYKAFLTFKALGDDRNYKDVARKENKSETLIKRWGSRYQWQQRIRNWAAEMEIEAHKQVSHRLAEMIGRQIGLATSLQLRAIERLEKMKPEELTPSDVVKFITLGVQMERTALGLDGSLKMAQVGQPQEISRPAGNIVEDAVKNLSAIDRGLLRDLTLKKMKILALEAEERKKNQAALPAEVPSSQVGTE